MLDEIDFFMKWIWKKRYSILLLSIAIIYCVPLLINISNLGGLDWDQYMFWREAPRIIMFKYGQFPLWNPFAGGGNVLLAHPQSCFF